MDISNKLEEFALCSHHATLLEDEVSARLNRRKLIIVCVLCLVFMFGEVVGGLYADSLAILGDAAHLFSDIVGFLISLVALSLASRKPTGQHSYGYHRAEVVGALFSVALIWAVTALLVMEAIERLLRPVDIDGFSMMIIAAAGLLVNIIMAFVLHRDQDLSNIHCHGSSLGHGHHCHDHDHGLSLADLEHGSGFLGSPSAADPLMLSDAVTIAALPPRRMNMNVRSALIHVIGDMIQSVGVLLASVIIYVRPEWRVVDPLCTFLFSAIVLFTTFRLFSEAVHVLMEGTPLSVDPVKLKADLLAVPGVLRVDDLHVWSLSSDRTTMTAHLAVSSETFGARYGSILKACQELMLQRYQIRHPTLQLEEQSCT